MYLAGVEDKVFALLDVRLQFWHRSLDEIHLEVRQFAQSQVLLHSILLQSHDNILLFLNMHLFRWVTKYKYLGTILADDLSDDSNKLRQRDIMHGVTAL